MQDPQNITLQGGQPQPVTWAGGRGHLHAQGGIGKVELQARTSPTQSWELLHKDPESSVTPSGEPGFEFSSQATVSEHFEMRVIDASQTGDVKVTIGYIERK